MGFPRPGADKTPVAKVTFVTKAGILVAELATTSGNEPTIYDGCKICCRPLTITPLGFGSAGFFSGRDSMIDQLNVGFGSFAP